LLILCSIGGAELFFLEFIKSIRWVLPNSAPYPNNSVVVQKDVQDVNDLDE
jgi:hypothetical protein